MKHSFFISLTLFILMFIGCKSAQNKEKNASQTLNSSVSLFQTEWELLKIGASKPKLIATDNKISILFSKDNSHCAGFSGCNRYSGKYNIKKENISFESIISTKMACPGNDMSFENNYLNTLQKITSYQIISDTLFLQSKGRTLLTYIAR